MKTTLLCALWTSVALTAVVLDGHAADRVFLLGGQSNMVGQGVNQELERAYTEPQRDVKFWKHGWVPLAPGFGNGSDYFGPEVSFGNAVKDALPDDTLYLVKYGSNGKALYNDFKPGTGKYFIEMINTFRAALADLDAAGIDYELSGMLWMQGESDAYEGRAADYETNLVNFINVMRTEFETPDMPFIIARVLDYFGGMRPPKMGDQTDPTQAHIVRTAQVRVAENIPFTAWFDTDDYQVVDPVSNPGHYGTRGLIEMGEDFAASVLHFILEDDAVDVEPKENTDG